MQAFKKIDSVYLSHDSFYSPFLRMTACPPGGFLILTEFLQHLHLYFTVWDMGTLHVTDYSGSENHPECPTQISSHFWTYHMEEMNFTD